MRTGALILGVYALAGALNPAPLIAAPYEDELLVFGIWFQLGAPSTPAEKQKVAEAASRKAHLAAHEGQYLDAIEHMDEALAASPGSISVLLRRGKYNAFAGRSEPAFDDFDRAAKLAPNLAEPRARKAKLRHLSGDYGEAIVEYDAAIALSGEGSGAVGLIRAKAYALAETGRLKDGLKAAKSADDMTAPFAGGNGRMRAATLDTLADMQCLAGAKDEARTLYEASWRMSKRREVQKQGLIEAQGYFDGSAGGQFQKPPELALAAWITDGCPGILSETETN